MEGRVLIVDDDASMCQMLAGALQRNGLQAKWTQSPEEALSFVESEVFDLVLTDLNMRGMTGVDLCQKILGHKPDMHVIVLTAYGSFESAVAAIRAGAYDFVTKPFETAELMVTLERALQHRNLRQEVKGLRKEVERHAGRGEMIGRSPSLKRVWDIVDRVASSDATVLVSGESGTGKELVARSLHSRSARSEGPFVAVNCAAMPETLLESELFGHAKGAFTDAKSSRSGLFVQANGGTLFLDEIGEMPLGMQPKLLRALQERTVRPVGSNQEVPFDVRLIAATNRDIEGEVEEGRFREDLFYRINVVRIDVPALRARGNDVLLLAQHFMECLSARTAKRVAQIAPEATEKLLAYSWPGNIRELENAIESAVAMTRGPIITVEDLPEKIRDHKGIVLGSTEGEGTELLSMEEVERRHIARVLAAVGGNKTQAAQTLGLDRRTLYRKLERYGIADVHPGMTPLGSSPTHH